MSGDLISREALKKSIEEYRNLNCVSTSTIIGVRNVMYLIDNAPTVDIKDELAEKARPQGEWISSYRECKCSICNFKTVVDTYRYCPNCGAYMRGDQE